MHDRVQRGVVSPQNQYTHWPKKGQKGCGSQGRGQKYYKSATYYRGQSRGRMDGKEFYGVNKGADNADNQMDYSNSTGQNYNIQLSDRQGLWKDRWNTNTNISPKRNKPYSQRKNSPSKPTKPNFPPHVTVANQNDGPTTTNGHGFGEDISPFDALVSGQLDQDGPHEHGVQGLVKKFDQDKKSSRQLLMLQQQIYQEEQAPIANMNNNSTQFYAHYTKYQAMSYYGYPPPPPIQQNGCYDNSTGGYDNSGGCYDNSVGYDGTGQYDIGNQGGYPYRNGYPSNQYDNYGNNINAKNYPYQVPTNQNSALQYNYGNSNTNSAYNKGFYPIRSQSPSDCSSMSVSPCDLDNEFPGSVELIIGNLDYNISPREWKHILTTTFHPHIKILHIDVSLQPDNTSLGFVKVGSIEEARFAISQFHRKKIGYKRIHVTLKTDDATKTVSTIRSEAISLLSDAKDNVLPLFKFIELFNKRYNRSVSVAELYKMRDTIEICEQGGSGRMIHLIPSLQRSPTMEEVENIEQAAPLEILEPVVCTYHCPVGSAVYAETVNTSILPNVKLHLKTFSAQVHSLLMTHDGDIPLMSFPACFSAEVCPLSYVYEGGIPLEHMISCVQGVQIVTSPVGVKRVSWAENKAPDSPDLSRSGVSPLLAQQLSQFNRDMVDLLKNTPNCRMAFSKFIPSYHHHFGRQCRVADYGYSKLMELFEAIPHVLQVIGTGDRKVLTLTHRAQVKRFTADLLRLLKTVPGKVVYLSTLTEEFCKLFNKNWDIVEYGVCQLEDMLSEMPTGTITMCTEGTETVISLPRKDQSPEEFERTKQFTLEVVDLLKHNHQCRMLFNKFVPAYHHHFGRQCRVSDFGFAKLLDLFESIPHIVEVEDEGEEKIIRLTEPELRKVVGEQIASLLNQRKMECFPLDQILGAFSQHYGFPIPLHDLQVSGVEELMAKLKHVLKVEVYDGKSYIVLSDRSSAPPLARQVLQLLMDQSGGSLPLMELCTRYKTTFGIDPDIQKIKEELLDYVQISGDDESGVISLTPLQILARDIRVLLQLHGKLNLAQFERLFYEQYCVDLKPALYGFPNTVALLMSIPHVVNIKGKGQRRLIHLSGDLQGSLPIIDEAYSRSGSDTTSNNSGSALMDEDTPPEHRKFSSNDLMGGAVPSNIPSPLIMPDATTTTDDLMKFDTPGPDTRDSVFILSEEDRKLQKTPLCQTPTSELLQLAAQFLPSSVMSHVTTEGQNIQGQAPEHHPKGDPSRDILDLLKHGWWRSSPSPNNLDGVSDNNTSQNVQENLQNTNRNNHTQADFQSMKGHTQEVYDTAFEDTTETKLDIKSNVTAQSGGQLTDKIQTDSTYSNKFKTTCHLKKQNGSDYKVAVQSLSATLSYLREQNQDAADKNTKNVEKGIKNVTKEVRKILKSESNEKDIIANKEDVKVDRNVKMNDEESVAEPSSPIALCPRPLQPGSYWYSKQFQQRTNTIELPSTSTQEVRNILALLSNQKSVRKPMTAASTNQMLEQKADIASVPNKNKVNSIEIIKKFQKVVETADNDEHDTIATPVDSIDTSESFSTSDNTMTEVSRKNIYDPSLKMLSTAHEKPLAVELEIKRQFAMERKNADPKSIEENENIDSANAASRKEFDHKLENCVSQDCMCYEAVFRQDHPLETSSIKSGSEDESPRKSILAFRQKLSTSSLSDESINSSIHRKRSRIAAKFGQTIE